MMIVFSDLDGTLLDHQTYDWQPARPALEQLQELGYPVVLVSSKTLPELAELQQQMGLVHPVVAENGAAIHVPDGYFSEDAVANWESPARAALQAAYEEVQQAAGYDCQAFYELGVSGIVRETGLTEERARLANERAGSEPILWRDSDTNRAAFEASMQARGLRCVQGGRFLHLMGDTGKEDAVGQLMRAYALKWCNEELISVSLGDAPNDLGMLAATDIAVIIPGKHQHPMHVTANNRVIRPDSPGPAGWNEAMMSLLSE